MLFQGNLKEINYLQQMCERGDSNPHVFGTLDPKSSASANSATFATNKIQDSITNIKYNNFRIINQLSRYKIVRIKKPGILVPG